jgi:hypothetical protein
MSGARELAMKGLSLGLAAARHTGWWLRWQTDRHASRELAELKAFAPRAAEPERRAA